MVKVSVVIPVYNVESFLKGCLETVIRQTLKELEIICVNDGSTDSSAEILKEYAGKDNRIIVLNQPNGGYGKAMNAGMRIASGEYVGIVEPDDMVSLTMFEDLYKAAVENDLDIVKADFYKLQTEESGSLYLVYQALDKNHEFYNRVVDPGEEPVISRTNIHTWAGIYRNTFLKDNNIEHHETGGASLQDVGFFWRSLFFAKRIMLLDRPYYWYRVDNPGSSIYDPAKMYAIVNEYAFVEEIMRKNPDLWSAFCSHFHYKKYFQFRYNIRRTAAEKRAEFVACFRDEFSRIQDLGELDLRLFRDTDAEELKLLLRDPSAFLSQFTQPDLKPPKSPSRLKQDNHNLREKYKKARQDLAESKNRIKSVEKSLRKEELRRVQAEKKYEAIESSAYYKLGKILLFIPARIRRSFHK